jgi:hypothetical protein
MIAKIISKVAPLIIEFIMEESFSRMNRVIGFVAKQQCLGRIDGYGKIVLGQYQKD